MLRLRYWRILRFFGGVTLGIIWWDIILPRLGLRRLSRRTRAQRWRRATSGFRQLAVRMGGVLIKIGQFFSARLDVLPRAITDELAGLQDEVKPETFETVRAVIESEFNAPLETRFSSFDPHPLASASIGQVHTACLVNAEGQSNGGACVVVKVQRPLIPALVTTDLAAFKVVGSWLDRYPPIRKRANVPALLEEFSRSVNEEIDYLAEGKNAETFHANFSGRADVRVPDVFWSHTTRRVLTLEDVRGIKITDYTAIENASIDRTEVAERLFGSYLKQIFDDHFFHADPHPGNLFIEPLASPTVGEKTPWRLVFVDFGMVGHLYPNVVAGFRELLIGVGTQDAARIIRAYQALDFLLPSADLALLEKAGARLFERFWGKSTKEMMSMHKTEAAAFVREFGDLLYEMPFQLPENMVLFGRCIGILSGMCTGLNPNFNMWTSISPYAVKMIEAESGGAVRTFLNEAGDLLRVTLALPRKADALLSRLEQGRLEVRNPEVKEQLAHVNRSLRRLVAAIIFAALLLGAVQSVSNNQPQLALALGTAALTALLVVLFTR